MLHLIDMPRTTSRSCAPTRTLRVWFATTAAVAGCSVFLVAQVSPETFERRVYVMGTRATLIVSGSSRTLATRSLNRMVRVMEETERDLTTWRAASLLSRLNRQPIGAAWHGPAWFCGLVGELGRWSTLTGGAFDPVIGSFVEAWGLRSQARRLDPAALEAARAAAGFRHVVVESNPCAVTRLADVTFDAGGFGKGVALDRIAELGESGLVDLGGQIAVFGQPPRRSWSVSIAHPEHREIPVTALNLTSGSLAVSGGSERDQEAAGEQVGHIVDPRTGQPVSRPLSVAVWHERALAADVLSTALYVMGPNVGYEWAETRGFAACFLIATEEFSDSEVVSVGSGSGVGDVELVPTTAFLRHFPQWRDPDLSVGASHRDKRVQDIEEGERCIGQGRDTECLGHKRTARVPRNQNGRERARILERP